VIVFNALFFFLVEDCVIDSTSTTGMNVSKFAAARIRSLSSQIASSHNFIGRISSDGYARLHDSKEEEEEEEESLHKFVPCHMSSVEA
jgi:hypothetical protein